MQTVLIRREAIPLAVLPPVPAERMTGQGRAYLLAASAQHLTVGLSLVVAPDTFDGMAFRQIFDIAPLAFWAVALLLGSAHLVYAAVGGHEGHARAALILSGTVSLMWACAFAYVIGSGAASVFAFSILVGCAIRDYIACARPLRSPFERLARLVSEEPRPSVGE